MGNLCTSCLSKPPKGDSDDRPTFLDDLPDEVLDNVIRHISASPRCQNWQNHVASADALALYAENGPLAGLARHHFRALSIPQRTLPDKALVADVSTRKLSRAFVKLLEAGGPSFVEINVELGHNPLTFSFAFYSAFARRCTGVRRMSLSGVNTGFPLRRLLKPRSGQLEALDLTAYHLSTAHVDAITKHCGGLLKLSLDVYSGWGHLAPIWRTVGPTLNELSLMATYCSFDDESKIWKDALTEVKDHCVQLSCISFEGFPDEAQDNIAYLCTSYGPKLKKLRFSDCSITANIYADIVRACSNVLVDTLTYAACLVNTLEALGPHVDVIRYGEEHHELLDFDVARVAAECRNIRSIIIDPMDVSTPELLTAILDSPKPLLETVEIGESYGHNRNWFRIEMQTLELLARRTGGIRHFSFSCELMPPDTFQEFARANARLETVEIILVRAFDHDAEEENVHPRRCPIELCLASIVEAFSVCKKLRKLLVEETARERSRGQRYNQVAEACVSLRNRQVHVTVFGEQYLA